MSHYVTGCVTKSHKISCNMSHMIWLGAQDTKCIDQVDYV